MARAAAAAAAAHPAPHQHLSAMLGRTRSSRGGMAGRRMTSFGPAGTGNAGGGGGHVGAADGSLSRRSRGGGAAGSGGGGGALQCEKSGLSTSSHLMAMLPVGEES